VAPPSTPDAPGSRTVRHLRQLVWRSLTEHFDDRCPQLAAAISYYTLFALFPLVILAAGIFGLVEGSEAAQKDIVDLVTENVALTPSGQESLEESLSGVAQNAGLFGVVGLLGLVFSASGVMGAIRNAINAAFDLEQRRAVLHGKLVDIGMIALVGVVAGVSLGLSLLHRLVPDLVGDGWLVGAAFALAPLVINFAVFTFLYRVLPATEVHLRDIWPGALAATLIYEAAKLGLTFYLANFGHYSAVYGPAATVVVFLFFVFIASNVFLFGAEVASEWPRVRAGTYDREEAARGRVPLPQRIRAGVRRLEKRLSRSS
jgi:membrane protein